MIRSMILVALLAAVAVLPSHVGPLSNYRTDTNHSTVGFSVPILGGISQVTGKFSRFKLQFDYDPEKPEESTLVAEIDATRVDTGIDERDRHLRSDDFLAVEEFPEILFESFEVGPMAIGSRSSAS